MDQPERASVRFLPGLTALRLICSFDLPRFGNALDWIGFSFGQPLLLLSRYLVGRVNRSTATYDEHDDCDEFENF